MNVIKETETNGHFHVDSPVTQADWLKVLLDKETPATYIDALIKFYYEPGHESTCGNLGKIYSPSYSWFNVTIMQFGKYIQNRFGFSVLGIDDKPSYWGTIMDGHKGKYGFVWKVKQELTEAIKDYLYLYLLEQYKKHRKVVPIDDTKTGERYKWDLITECEGKPLIDIAERIRTTNLVYAAYANGTIDWLYQNKHDAYEEALKLLVTDKPLKERLEDFSPIVRKLLKDNTGAKSYKANDERTVSTILACHNPAQYTFYKRDNYQYLCAYLGIDAKKKVYERFPHFLQLLKPLKELIDHDKELPSIVDESLQGAKKSNLLMAQDVCWEMFIKHPDLLVYPPKKKYIPRYWCVGYNIDGQSQIDDFKKEKVWKGLFRIKEDASQLKSAEQIRKSDILILKASLTRGENHDISFLRVLGFGVATEESEDYDAEREGYAGVCCHVNYVNFDVKEFVGGSFGSYRNTIKECKEKEIIDYIESLRNSTMSLNNKYKKFLERNYNMILTGAPGTGKTFLAKQIAADMIGCEVDDLKDNKHFGFVQFHPSYDYTDFVEGIRPSDEDGKEFDYRPGIFKKFCATALETADTNNYEEAYSKLADELENRDEPLLIEFSKNRRFGITLNSRGNLNLYTGKHLQKNGTLTKEAVRSTANGQPVYEYWKCYYEGVVQLLKKNYGLTVIEAVDKKPFVFVIDEINRGEISKIFGELFFSIDPGYRGVKGFVQTQYQNMIQDGPFMNGFYVPDNVYIIGTMNDIDRSVESLDFAFRRRFPSIEVKYTDTMDAILAQLDNPDMAQEIKKRLIALNDSIEKDENLGPEYCIGGSYALKLNDVEGSYEELWQYYLEPVICEYLKGLATDERKEHLRKLATAFGINEQQ